MVLSRYKARGFHNLAEKVVFVPFCPPKRFRSWLNFGRGYVSTIDGDVEFRRDRPRHRQIHPLDREATDRVCRRFEPEDEVEHSGGYGGGDYEKRECGEGEAAAAAAAAPPALSAAREGFELLGVLRRRIAKDLGMRSDLWIRSGIIFVWAEPNDLQLSQPTHESPFARLCERVGLLCVRIIQQAKVKKHLTFLLISGMCLLKNLVHEIKDE